MKPLSEADAAEYASWFRCLSDATRVRILNFVACTDAPVTVGEIVEAVGRSQSTVSKHLALLAEDSFIHCEPDGVRTLVRANETCMTALPEAAATIMGVST